MPKLNLKRRDFPCLYCNHIIKKEWRFFGKKLYVALKCPSCGLINEYPLLNKTDKVFLRLGFLFNPLYLPKKSYVDGAPFKLVAVFYPLLFLLYIVINVLYMPLGLLLNNVLIHRSKQRFFFDNENVATKLIYYGNLRKLADEGHHYAALLVGENFLEGTTYAENYEHAKHYLELALATYPSAGLKLGLNNFHRQNYLEAYRYFNLSKTEPQSLYYLAVMHVQALGIAKNVRLAKAYLHEARTGYKDDPYNIEKILRR